MKDLLLRQSSLEVYYFAYFLFVGSIIFLTTLLKDIGNRSEIVKKWLRVTLIVGTIIFLLVGTLVQQLVSTITLHVPLIIAGTWVTNEVFLKGKRITKVFNTEVGYDESLCDLVNIVEGFTTKLVDLCEGVEWTKYIQEQPNYHEPVNAQEALVILEQALDDYLTKYGIQIFNLGQYQNDVNIAKNFLDTICTTEKMCYNDIKYNEIIQNILNQDVQVVMGGKVAIIPIVGKTFNQVLYIKTQSGKNVEVVDATIVKIIGRMIY